MSTVNKTSYVLPDENGYLDSSLIHIFSKDKTLEEFAEEDVSDLQDEVDEIDSKHLITKLGTSIPTGSNLNSYKTFGRYYIPSTASCTNLPFTGSASISADLIVMPRAASNRCYQFIVAFISSTSVKIWFRAQTADSVFTDWILFGGPDSLGSLEFETVATW